MDFIDLKIQQKRIKETLNANIQKVLTHGNYIMGPELRELEVKLAAYVGVKHTNGCAAGTVALLVALMAYGIGPGDAIFTSPFTFIATAEVISLLGATSVFVDVDPVTLNIDPINLGLAIQAVKANYPSLYPLPKPAANVPFLIPPALAGENLPITPSPSTGEGWSVGAGLRPRGVLPVDLFGLSADYDAINAIAKDNGFVIIEDAAQSFGAVYKGKRAGALADVACTSFFPAKPLGCYSDGGMCFTDDDGIAAALDSVRVHGKGSHKYDNARIGINGRLDTLQAAIFLAKFAIFPEEVQRRQEFANRYTAMLAGASVQPPYVPPANLSAWAQYSVLAEDETHRADLLKRQQEAKIPAAIYYPRPLHLQMTFAFLGYVQGAFPVSEDAASRIFSIPMHPYLTEQDQAKIAETIKS